MNSSKPSPNINTDFIEEDIIIGSGKSRLNGKLMLPKSGKDIFNPYVRKRKVDMNVIKKAPKQMVKLWQSDYKKMDEKEQGPRYEKNKKIISAFDFCAT